MGVNESEKEQNATLKRDSTAWFDSIDKFDIQYEMHGSRNSDIATVCEKCH